MKRNRREHGRILSVETKTRGSALAADYAAGVTTISVDDAGDFDEDGGWLYVGTQTVEYLSCDDDAGTIVLADPLAVPGDQGDPVEVWSDIYDEVVDFQEALVELDGEYDNPDPVIAEVAEGVGELPEGDRGKAGESCTLQRVADDEWEVVGVGGRAKRSKSLRAEADDFYVLTAADITAGAATFPLSHRPADEWLILWWRTTAQEPTQYTINYDAQTITYPLSGFEAAGDRLWAHYAYRKGLGKRLSVPVGSLWRWKDALGSGAGPAAVGYDDSTWSTGPSGFGRGSVPADVNTITPPPVPTAWNVWTRLTATSFGGDLDITISVDLGCTVYVDGVQVYTRSTSGTDTVRVPAAAGEHTFAAYAYDTASSLPGEGSLIVVTIEEVR